MKINMKPEFQIALACRYAVKDQINTAKERFFETRGHFVVCEESGELISKENSHVDHAAPLTMQVLVRTFFAVYNVKMTTRLIHKVENRNSHFRFKNPKWAERFRRFHKRVAVLRVVSAKVNLREKVYIPKPVQQLEL